MRTTLPPNRAALAGQAEKLCRERGASLLFLTLFGATLYGTETPAGSDLDVRGVFLPSAQSLTLNNAPRSLHFSTGGGGGKNTATDVDIGLDGEIVRRGGYTLVADECHKNLRIPRLRLLLIHFIYFFFHSALSPPR